MGVKFINSENGIKNEVSNIINSTIIDGSQCPDIIPVLAATASLAKGRTEIINAGRLRIKECDRLAAVNSELSKLGINIIEKEDGLIIDGVDSLEGGIEVWSHKDHRIAMTLAIVATRCKNPIITAVNSELSKLGVNIIEKEDGLIIDGVDSLEGGIEVWSHKDHRIAMTLAIVATRCKNPIIIKDYECIAKSYPKFFEDYKMLGGKVDEWNVGK